MNPRIDRLRNLPDPLLSQILSLLPTENAVATGVLSRRWKFLWTSITSLNFDGKGIGIEILPKEVIDMKRTKFTLFVNRVLLLTTPPCIQIFRFNCADDLCNSSYLSLWITAIAPTVRELDLRFFHGMELPMSDFYWNKFVVLKLEGSIHFKIPEHAASVCFPCLQMLHLSRIGFEIASNSSVSFPYLRFLCFHNVESTDEESVSKLFSSCPVLDDLDVRTEHWKNILRLVCCIPSLTRLKLYFWGYYDPPNEIQINKLQRLKFLSLSSHALKAINSTTSANISLSFHNLKRLELKAYDCSQLRVAIKNLLESMGNLEHLVMTRRWCWCSRECWTSWWTEPLNVPECLLSQVTTISFTQTSDDCHDELELVRYLLKNAKVLQVFKVGTQSISSDRKLQLLKKISMFPRGSQACQVEFT